MSPYVFQARPFLNYFASLHKEEQKEILKMLALYLMRVMGMEGQSKDDIEDIFNNHPGEWLNEEELTQLKSHQSLPKNLSSLPKEKKTAILKYIFELHCNFLHEDDKLKIFNYFNGVEEEVIFYLNDDDDDERKKMKDIIVNTMEHILFEWSIDVYESRENKNDEQEEWTIDCAEIMVDCNICSLAYSNRSIVRHAWNLHGTRGTVKTLSTISHDQSFPKKKRKEKQQVKRLQESYRVYCRVCGKDRSIRSIKDHALNKHEVDGTVEQLSTPVKR